MTTATQPAETAAASREPFQFRIHDLLFVMLLVALAAGAAVQRSGVLFILWLAAVAVCLYLWRKWWMPVKLIHVLLFVGGIGLLIALLLPAIGTPREVSRRMSCGNNLKQIVLALHNYHDIYGSFPPAYIADKHGRPMHSWRVLILPFIEQDNLYKQYRFDEPWDGPNNSKLAGQIGRVYSCPSHDSKNNKPVETNYVAIIGPGTVWPGEEALSLSEIPDGTANVFLVVEVHNSGIHWMEPRDLHVLQMAPGVNPKAGQGISSAHPNGAQVGMADGAIKFLPDDLPTAVLHSQINIDDGTLPLPQ